MRLLLNLDVDNPVRAETFFTEAFGLHVHRRLGEGVIELHGAEISIYLLSKPAGAMTDVDLNRNYARHWTPIHCDVMVDDLQQAIVQAVAAGATQEGAVRSASWGRIAQLADPFGHGWCLLQFIGQGYDEIASPS